MSTQDRARTFVALHQREEILVLPNPWDVGSARLMAHLGFEALATTSAGFAHSLGRPDGGVTRDEALSHAADVVAATTLPVSADLEGCFADEPDGVYETVRAAIAVGLVGCSVEDATGDPDDPIYDDTLAVARVVAAIEAARNAPYDFVLTARAENYLHGRRDLGDTVGRLEAFAAAGAPVVYAPGLADDEEIRAAVGSTDLYVNVLALPGMNTAHLQDLGVHRVSIGSGFSKLAYSAMADVAARVKATGVINYGSVPSVDLNAVFEPWNRT